MKKKVSAILSHLLSNAIKFTNMDIEIGCFKATAITFMWKILELPRK
jgi:signal transduction histidine kinase